MDLTQQLPFSGTRPAALNVVTAWMAFGLTVLISFPLLPVDNYATLVYWLFYAPLLILMVWQRATFAEIWRNTDPVFRACFTTLLIWVALSAIWAKSTDTVVATVGETLRYNLLIALFVAGVMYLAHVFPRALWASLLAGVCIVSLAGATSVLAQYYSQGIGLSERLASIGILGWRETTNSVVSGIYFGTFGVISAIPLLTKRDLYRPLQVVLGVGLGCCLLTVAATGTRTAMVAMVGTGLFALAATGRIWLLATLFVLSVGGIVLAAAIPDSPLHGLLTRGGVGSWRPEIWLESLRQSTDQLLFGAGYGTPMTLEAARDGEMNVQHHSHSFYLQLLFWSGLPGLALYIATLGRSLSLSLGKTPQRALGFYGLVYFCIVQVFDVYDVFTTPSYYWPCLWLPLALGCCPTRVRTAVAA